MSRSEVLKFSAGGFRDFTRIAASDPTMWRDVFLHNKDAVLEMLAQFNEDLAKLTRAMRRGDGDTLFDHFTRTRAIRRGIVQIGQDSAAPDFGRAHPAKDVARSRGRTRRIMSSARSSLPAKAGNPVNTGHSELTGSSAFADDDGWQSARFKSRNISRAALCPGSPVTPPPGCVPEPHM